MTRALGLWLVPVFRRLVAPELSADELRAEVRGDEGRLKRLYWASGTWLLILIAAAVGSLPFTFLSTLSIWADRLARTLLVLSGVAAVPLVIYSVLFAVARRRTTEAD